MHSIVRARAHVVLLALVASTLVRCSCEEDPVFVPGVTYEPTTLNFGDVAVDQEKTLDIKVISNGSAGLKINQYTFPSSSTTTLAKFTFEGRPCAPDVACTNLKSELTTTGVRPGETSSVTVTYRPCPDAWNGDAIKPDYNFARCPVGADQMNMVINDNSRDQTHTITIVAQPAQQPNIAVFCNRSGQQCNQPLNADAAACNSLGFGAVTAGDTPCDIEVELRNVRRDNKPTAPLNIERLDLYVTDVNHFDMQIDGRTVGFSFLDTAGAPVVLPQQIAVPVGAAAGAFRMKVRFDGSGDGTWIGTRNAGHGLRIYHDDPSADKRPVVGMTVTAIGASPAITAQPPAIDFGPVEQGTSRTATVVIGNAGSATLNLRDLQFAVDRSGNKFSVTTDQGPPPFSIPANTFAGARLYVRYSPVSAGQDSDELRIGSNDMNNNPVIIPVSGGATPRIRVDPMDNLVFELPNPPPPPPAPPRTKTVRVTNVGYGDLVIQQVDLLGPDDDRAHPSVDDFSIAGCTSYPCNQAVTLCPPSSPACTMPGTDIEVTYRNNDNSTQDLVTLYIYSTDPANPVYRVVLSAEDRPCLSPTPVIMVDTPNPTVGTEVCVTCSSSSPGGPPTMPAMIAGCDWSFAFSASAPIPTLNPAQGPRSCFMPTQQGLHIVSLNVTNDCGSASSTPATEVITVRGR